MESLRKKKKGTYRYREHICGCQSWGLGMGEFGEDGPKLQTSSNISPGDAMYIMVITVNKIVLYIWKFLDSKTIYCFR